MRILSPALAIAILAATAQASAQPLSRDDRQAIVQDVIEHFRRNPQELVEAIVDWRKRQAEDVKTAAPPDAPVSGNPGGDVTVFEFSDYGCEPCRRLSTAVDAVAAKDGSVRIVHHDYPVSGSDAMAASMDLASVYASGGNWQALRAAYLAQGVAPETRIAALSAAGLQAGSEGSKEAAALLTANRALAARAGVAQMPAIIVAAGDKVQALSGAMAEAEVAAAVAAIRQAARSAR